MSPLSCCLLLLMAIVGPSIAQPAALKSNLCVEQATCGQCMEAGGQCGWCTQDNYDADNKARCDLLDKLVRNGCDDTMVVRPDNNITMIQNHTFTDSEKNKPAIQLAPQKMNIKLRPNKPFTFNVQFRQARNYPVDLYYIMDLSQSMADDKNKLAELGDLLAQRMANITEDFRLGFGSFVDKKTMPYVSTLPAKLAKPCDGCVAPYGFKNELSLTGDTKQFRTKVINANISGNLDSPEGGFDAIMQSIMCKADIGWRVHSRKLLLMATDSSFHMAGDGKMDIGWRDNSRKMLLFSTDAGFHQAGDGKLGGIVLPNDGYCHMDRRGYYSESLNQDYPSISQLAYKITESKVNVIFAVTSDRVKIYQDLSQFIEGSTVGKLANDSSNIVELVQDNYSKISSEISLKTEGNDGIDVTFRSKCLGDEMRETDTCRGLRIGQMVSYEVTVEVKKCPKKREDWKKSFFIYPVGLTEKLNINLELICECQCELPQFEVTNSDRCNKSGTFECGACTCNKGHYGKECECDGSNLNSEDYDAVCRATNTSEVCSGNGQCLCGVCDCNPITPGDPSKRYSRKFCQCDDYSCDYFNNQLCAGPKKGKCVCGDCDCYPGYNGTACECPISIETCRARPTEKGKPGLICNGKGSCECGKCRCDRDTYYRGDTCEDCPTCPGKCEKNKACVQCHAFGSGEYTKEYCEANCTHINIVDTLESNNDQTKMCQFRDEDDCIFFFAYEYNSNIVYAQRTKECPEPVDPLAIALAVIGAIVAIGLALLLIWKLLTTIHDRREFAKFEKERQNAKWDTGENPIYKQATSRFTNPTYAGKQ